MKYYIRRTHSYNYLNKTPFNIIRWTDQNSNILYTSLKTIRQIFKGCAKYEPGACIKNYTNGV